MKDVDEHFEWDSADYDFLDYEPEHHWFGWIDSALVVVIFCAVIVVAQLDARFTEKQRIDDQIAQAQQDPYYPYQGGGSHSVYAYSGNNGTVIFSIEPAAPSESYSYQPHPDDGSWVLTSLDYGEAGQHTEECYISFRGHGSYEWPATDDGICDFEAVQAANPDMPNIIPETS